MTSLCLSMTCWPASPKTTTSPGMGCCLMPDISDLTYFRVVRTVSPVPAGILTADVTFEAQITKGVAVQAEIGPDVLEVLARPVHARIVDGVLMRDGTAGV